MKPGIRHLFLALATLLPRNGLSDKVVTSNADSGPGSLRQAIIDVAPGQTITFDPGVISPILLTSGELGIGKDLQISGPGATNLTIDGNANDRVFEIGNGASVTISGLTIRNGLVHGNPAHGGGILVDDNTCGLTLSNCWVQSNTAQGDELNNGAGAFGEGGGIYNAGQLVSIGCTFSGNTVLGGAAIYGQTSGSAAGGGIATVQGAALRECTVTGNVATGGDGFDSNNAGGDAVGGGIEVDLNGSLTIIHSTITGNTAQGGSGAGGLAFGGLGRGGGLDISANSGMNAPTLLDTIVALNSAIAGSPNGTVAAPDAYGSVLSQGFNLIGQTNDSSGWVTTSPGKDITGSTQFPQGPDLGPLQFNGGPTPTMAPLPGSAAIDNGTTAGASTDQRGLPRPVHQSFPPHDPLGGDGSDIGAVELQLVQLYIEPTFVAGERQFTLYWQNTEPSYHLVRLLQTSHPGILSNNWTISSLPIMTINGTNRAAITSPTNNAFFRLLLAP